MTMQSRTASRGYPRVSVYGTYTHLFPEMHRAAAESIESVVGKALEPASHFRTPTSLPPLQASPAPRLCHPTDHLHPGDGDWSLPAPLLAGGQAARLVVLSR